MAFTFVGGVNGADGSGSSVASVTSAAISVTAGDLVVAWASYEGTSVTVTGEDSDANAMSTPAAQVDNPGASGEPHARFLYIIAPSTGSKTYKAKFSSNRAFVNINVLVYTPTALPAYATSAGNAASSGTALTTGNITVSGTDGIAFAGYAEYGASFTFTPGVSPTINALAYEQFNQQAAAKNAIWARRYSAGFTAGGAGTLNTSNRWTAGIIAFEIGGGGGGTAFPHHYYQQMRR